MKCKNALVRCAAVMMFLVMTLCVSTGCSVGILSGIETENPKKSIIGFIEAMQSEEFDRTAAQTAMGYIANYSTMGFERYTLISDDELEKQLFDILRKSYEVKFSDGSLDPIKGTCRTADMTVAGKEATVKLKFVSVDYTLMSEPLSEVITEIAADRMYEGETYETEADAVELAAEIFGTVFTSDTDLTEYCVERELTLCMEYIDGVWKIVVSDEFYNALLGK